MCDAPPSEPKRPNDKPKLTVARPPSDATPTSPVRQQLLAYWQSKLNGRKAPRREDILPEELGALLPWVVLLDVVGTPSRFRVRLAGTGVVREYGAEMTGQFLDDVDLGVARDRSLDDHRRAVSEFRPVVGTFEFKKRDGRWMSYERIALPLSADGKTVNMLLCGARMHGAGAHTARRFQLPRPRSVGAKWPD